MLRKVQIVKKATGQKLVEYSMDLGSKASDDDYLKKAWYTAIDKGDAIEANRINYEIVIVEETPRE